MRSKSILAAAASAALLATPAWAIAAGPPSNPGADHPTATNHPSSTSNPGSANKPSTTPTANDNPGSEHKPATPGPNANAKAKGKAYGKYCKNQSKKHIAGQKGTPFSQCVTAMAKLASGKTTSPRAACKDASKKHVAGQKGTPFSRCVTAAAKLLKDQHADDTSETTAPTTETTTPSTETTAPATSTTV